MYDRKKIRSAQNVTDVSFFVVVDALIIIQARHLGFSHYDLELDQLLYPLYSSKSIKQEVGYYLH